MSTVNRYSLKKDGERRLAPNFAVREFACHDGADAILIADELVVMLQAVRDHYERPLLITSGYRTAAWNKRVGGVANSQHLLGNAADINVVGVMPDALFAAIVLGEIPDVNPERIGCGIYRSFVHVDVRGHKARWAGTGAKLIAEPA